VKTVNVPNRIAILTATRQLALTWQDGRIQLIDHATLRARCPCSMCRRIALSGASIDVRSDLALLDVQSMGYGVQLIFSDGHAQGIYPWPYLAALPSAHDE
jgi:DUF971 family protein